MIRWEKFTDTDSAELCVFHAMTAPERPAPPVVGKVTHHSVELYWEESLAVANKDMAKGDARVRITVQEQDKHGIWGNVYTGYAKGHVMEGLEPWTQYKYRIRFMNEYGNSEWSPAITVSTTREPMSGDHVHKAIIMQDLMAMERVLDSGDVKADIPDKYGFTPLMQASQKGYLDMVECLIKYGADVNYQNDSGKTSLMLASYAGKLEVIKELLYHGAKLDFQDKGGSTALHWAMDGGNVELIEYLVEKGADVNKKDYNGWTPLLRLGAVTGNDKVCRAILNLGANLNVKDKDGKTALMIAVVNGHQGMVQLLLERNVDITVKNEFGKTAYEMAQSMEKSKVIKTLEDYMMEKGIRRF